MNELLNLLGHLAAPGSAVLDQRAWLVISVSALVGAGGVLLAVAPQAVLQSLAVRTRRARPAPGTAGPGEYGLRAEFWGRIGLGITVWCVAFILANLLRVVGTSGLTSQILSALALLVVVFLAGNVVVYRLKFYPRYLEECRRLDTRKAYEPAVQAKYLPRSAKKGASKAKAPALRVPNIKLNSTQATVAAMVAPFIYYFIAIFALPNAANHDHGLHQLGMVVAALLGYTIGLTLSLGDGLRTGSFWPRARRG